MSFRVENRDGVSLETLSLLPRVEEYNFLSAENRLKDERRHALAARVSAVVFGMAFSTMFLSAIAYFMPDMYVPASVRNSKYPYYDDYMCTISWGHCDNEFTEKIFDKIKHEPISKTMEEAGYPDITPSIVLASVIMSIALIHLIWYACVRSGYACGYEAEV